MCWRSHAKCAGLQEIQLRPPAKESKAAAGKRNQQRQSNNGGGSGGGDKDEPPAFNLDQMFGQGVKVVKTSGIPAAQACTLAQLFLVLRKVTSMVAHDRTCIECRKS
jgi:hypothetical protein